MRDLIPRRELRTMTDRLFGDFWKELEEVMTVPVGQLCATGRKYSYPRINIKNLDNEYSIEAAVPGLTKDDVKVDYADGVLTISASSQNSKDEEQNGYLVRELHKSSFSRSVVIDPEQCRVEDIEAEVADGILSVKIPKKTIDKPPDKRIIKVS
jgi:HSP20 family protein